MRGLELAVLVTGVIVMGAGVGETTRQALSDALDHLSLRRWFAAYLLGIAPFVALGFPLVWLGAWGVLR